MPILIIAPRYKPYGQFYELPLGLAYISSYLKSKGKEVKFINLNEFPEDYSLEKDIRIASIICTGGLSTHYWQIHKILTSVRKINPYAITIVGGGIVSSNPELMREHLGFDVGITGEGEHKINTILDDPTRLPYGLHKSDPIKDLDALPFPDYEGLNVRAYLDRQLCGDEHYLYLFDKPRCLPIISSRGCPYNCTFCFHPTGKVYRQRSLSNFFKEVEYLIENYQINTLSVLDELISVDPERLARFCDRISKYKINWMTQMRVDSVTKDTIKMLRASGCYQISYGIESADNSILESMGKHITIERIQQALEWTYEAGIGIQGNLIFGDKNETLATAQKTLDWWYANRKFMLNLTYVIPYPGSELYTYAVSKGLIFDQIEYIQNGCPTVSLSSEMRPISALIEEYRPYGILFAQVYWYEKTTIDQFRGQLYRVSVCCPHCGDIYTYENIYYGSTGKGFTKTGYRIACRNCNQRFDIPKEIFIN